MVVLLLAVIAGAVAGVLVGGRVAALTRVRLRAWPLVLAALAAESSLGALPPGLRWAVAAGACAAVAAWSLRNREGPIGSRPFLLVAAGTALNSIAIAVNGGMPVSGWAARAAGLGSRFNAAQGHFYKHVASTGGTHLRAIGDIIPLPPEHMVLSAGDVMMLLGVALLVKAGTRWPEETPTPRQRASVPDTPAAR